MLDGAIVRDGRLRWPVPPNLPDLLAGRLVRRIWRRAKYLLFDIEHGHLILHLGMSGSLRVVDAALPPEKHDHVDLLFKSGDQSRALRYRDPRRFGCLLYQPGELAGHPLLSALGPEPLEADFHAAYLTQALAKKTIGIKLALMDNHVVVGVGNIYANEALFRAGIHPSRPANELRSDEYARLVAVIKATLAEAIDAGGSTLRDFVDSTGKPGYFQQRYFVYGRGGDACLNCGGLIREAKMGQRATFWCDICQAR